MARVVQSRHDNARLDIPLVLGLAAQIPITPQVEVPAGEGPKDTQSDPQKENPKDDPKDIPQNIPQDGSEMDSAELQKRAAEALKQFFTMKVEDKPLSKEDVRSKIKKRGKIDIKALLEREPDLLNANFDEEIEELEKIQHLVLEEEKASIEEEEKETAPGEELESKETAPGEKLESKEVAPGEKLESKETAPPKISEKVSEAKTKKFRSRR